MNEDIQMQSKKSQKKDQNSALSKSKLYLFKSIKKYSSLLNGSANYWKESIDNAACNCGRDDDLIRKELEESNNIHNDKIFQVSPVENKKSEQDKLAKKNYTKKWTDEEYAKLVDNYFNLKIQNYNKLSEIIKTKSPFQCSYKIKKIQQAKNIKNFTRTEDIKIVELVDKYNKNWNKISSEFDWKFTPEEIEDRYNSKLNPNLKTSRFSLEEDTQIMNLYNQFGKDWKKIATFFPDRSDKMIKNRFYSFLKKKNKRKVDSSVSNSASCVDTTSLILGNDDEFSNDFDLLNKNEKMAFNFDLNRNEEERVFDSENVNLFHFNSKNNFEGMELDNDNSFEKKNCNNYQNNNNNFYHLNSNNISKNIPYSCNYQNDELGLERRMSDEENNYYENNNNNNNDIFMETYQKVFPNHFKNNDFDDSESGNINDYRRVSEKTDEGDISTSSKQTGKNNNNNINNNNDNINNNNQNINNEKKISPINKLFDEVKHLENILQKIDNLKPQTTNDNNYEDVDMDVYYQLLDKKQKINKYKNILGQKLKTLKDECNALFKSNQNYTQHLFEINEILMKLINVGKISLITNKKILDIENALHHLNNNNNNNNNSSNNFLININKNPDVEMDN